MTVPIATRASWGARRADGEVTLSGMAAEVFAHHTVTAQLPENATAEQERAQMRVLEDIGHSRFTRPGVPNAGISYNVLIFPSGRAYQGVSWQRRGTHTDARNSTVRSICFVGNYDVHQPTPAQLATAAAIFAEGRGKWWVASAPLRGHRDIKSTACPGRHVYARLGQIRAGEVPVPQEEDMPLTKEERELLEDTYKATRWVMSALGGTNAVGKDGKRKDATARTDLSELLDIARRAERRDAARDAAIATLATSAGVDPDIVTATIERAVDRSLTDLSITLTTDTEDQT